MNDSSGVGPRFVNPLRDLATEPGAAAPGRWLFGAALCLALLGVAVAIGVAADALLNAPNLLLVFLPVVLFAAARYGLWMGLAVSVASVLASNYFLAHPKYSLAVADPGMVWTTLFFFVVAGFTSALAARVRHQTETLARSARTTEQLYHLSSTLAAQSGTEALLRAGAEGAAAMLDLEVVLLAPRDGVLNQQFGSAGSRALNDAERDAAAWCYEHGQPAGRGTGTSHSVEGLYLPLRAGTAVVGVIGVYGRQAASLLPAEQMQLLDVLRDQIGISLERTQLTERMQEASILLAADQLRSALLTSISHDLRTPLSTILGNISSLQEYGALYDEQTRTEMLQLAEAEAWRLARFVDNLLHMTRIDGGTVKPTLEAVDLSDLVGSAVTRSRRSLGCHRIRTELPATLPMVQLDFVLTEQVLVNLLDNAGKYAPPGTEVSIRAGTDGDRLVIEVTDEGPGIDEAELALIFDRFYRARETDRRQAGTGLGLSICKGFVEAMGGAIRASNRHDRHGAVFTVELPLSPAADMEAR